MKNTTQIKLRKLIERIIREELSTTDGFDEFLKELKSTSGIKSVHYNERSNIISIKGNTTVRMIEKILSNHDFDAWVEKKGGQFVIDFNRRNRNSEDNAPPYPMGSELSAPTAW